MYTTLPRPATAALPQPNETATSFENATRPGPPPNKMEEEEDAEEEENYDFRQNSYYMFRPRWAKAKLKTEGAELQKNRHMNVVDEWLRRRPDTALWRCARAVQGVRNYVFITLVYPRFSKLARALATVSLLMVVTCLCAFLLSHQPVFLVHEPLALTVLKWVTIVFFTVEFVLKALTASSLWWYLELMTVVDLAMLVPFYVGLFVHSFDFGGFILLQALHLLRLFRIFKMGTYNTCLQIMQKAFWKSRDSAVLLLALLFIELTLFSTFIFFAECQGCKFDTARRVWVYDAAHGGPRDSPFQSIPGAYWWCISTVSSVGYGDAFPVTAWGKVVASLAMVIGVVTLAYPVGVYSSNYVRPAQGVGGTV
eukprot:TRINITY_DN2270_c0_g1_i6.p1 TRINITY_DN2270_c0_g1~~TRINITY_DN2270_c0_g1_i6.p1  ORF type:complete len:367 (+),score=69.60 TRINITY_DN2270_c0_g1_i6:716-1816(+)